MYFRIAVFSKRAMKTSSKLQVSSLTVLVNVELLVISFVLETEPELLSLTCDLPVLNSAVVNP